MGLDMYLTARKDFFDKDTQEYKRLQEVTSSNFEAQAIVFGVGYWRKANQIHKWFVTNVQDGKDDCSTYLVTEENIQNLLDEVNKALKSSNPSEILPTQGGYFFGSTEYDEDYLDGLTHTKEILEKVLHCKEDLDFYYHSSW